MVGGMSEKLRDMLPRYSFNDQRYCSASNFKDFRKLMGGYSLAMKSSDFKHGRVVEPRLVVLLSSFHLFWMFARIMVVSSCPSFWMKMRSMAVALCSKAINYGMPPVLRICTPFKIRWAIIRLFPILMVNAGMIERIRNKCFCYKPRNNSSLSFSASTKIYHPIASPINSSCHNFVFNSFVVNRISPDSSDITNRVVRKFFDLAKFFRRGILFFRHGALLLRAFCLGTVKSLRSFRPVSVYSIPQNGLVNVY